MHTTIGLSAADRTLLPLPLPSSICDRPRDAQKLCCSTSACALLHIAAPHRSSTSQLHIAPQLPRSPMSTSRIRIRIRIRITLTLRHRDRHPAAWRGVLSTRSSCTPNSAASRTPEAAVPSGATGRGRQQPCPPCAPPACADALRAARAATVSMSRSARWQPGVPCLRSSSKPSCRGSAPRAERSAVSGAAGAMALLQKLQGAPPCVPPACADVHRAARAATESRRKSLHRRRCRTVVRQPYVTVAPCRRC